MAAEPIKVGIKLKPIQPAVYGDYVWIDTVSYTHLDVYKRQAIYNAGHLSSCSQVIGGTVTFTGLVIADVGYADGTNPVCALLIPSGFTYVPGSETFTANNSGITTPPTLEIIPNYITTGGKLRDLYRWTFPSGTILPHGERFLSLIHILGVVLLQEPKTIA